MFRSLWIPLVLVMAAAGCAAPPTPTDPPAPPDTETLVAETEVSIPLPTVTPVTPLPVDVPPNMPADFTPNELAAAVAPANTPYSGYNCSMTTDACTCDEPTILSVTLTFQPGNLLTYAFAGDLYGATWEMTRIAPDQWSYTLKIGTAESGSGSGSYFYLMTMQPAGFKMTQRRDADGTSVTCPDAVFTRMGS